MNETSEATFAAGCFWGVEETFRKLPGVLKTEVGFSGGQTVNPSYEEVCQGTTNHAESVHIYFDPKIVSYEALLEIFWQSHDPTTLNRQGPDLGSQYRSIIFYHDNDQKAAAEFSKQALKKNQKYSNPIVTEIIPATKFYLAEEYHQHYLQKKRAR